MAGFLRRRENVVIVQCAPNPDVENNSEHSPRTALSLDSMSPPTLFGNLYNLPHPTHPQLLKFSPDES